IEEIQVTATRRPAQASDVSAALAIIDNEKIRQGKLTTDALLMQPGIFLQQTTPGQGAAIVRGLKGSEVLHLVDGFRLNNAIFRNAPTQYFALVAPGSAERVEVLRGAPASLYGSDAVAGVVQFLSRKPQFESRRADLYLAYDAADLGKIVRASYEIGNERLAGLVSGEYLEAGHRRVGGGQRIVPSAYEAGGARIAVSANPDDNESWFFDLQFARQPSTPRTDELVPGFGQTTPSSEEFLFRPNERIFAHLKHTREDALWSADWTFDAGWQRIVDDRLSRNFASDIRRLEDNSSDLFGVTVNAAKEYDDRSWIAGIDVYYDRVDSRRIEEDLASGQTTDTPPRFPDGATMAHVAVFTNVMQRIGDRHTVSGGLRFSTIETDIRVSSTRQDDVSADIGWLFDMTERTQLTANLGYGFRAPNVFDLGTLGERPGNRFNIPNPQLDSEHIAQFDVGIRHQRRDWRVEATLFSLHYTDRIASVLTGAQTVDGRDIVQSRNVASADIRGIEASLHAALSPSLGAALILNYVHGEQTEIDGSKAPADRIPPFNGRLSLRYQASNAWAFEAYSLFAGSQDRLSPRDVQDSRINPAGTPGWVTANVAATWTPSERLRTTVRLENILDKRYRMHGSGVDAQGWNLMLSLQVTR
ncbi:MAG: TonB-dependent receptor, partial [Woeseiaceae bacterium]|nr:TonB-dependent receptor [Woeseiaceae bacterium]